MTIEAPRRALLGAGLALVAGRTQAGLLPPEPTAWDFTFPSIEGDTIKLADYRGRVLLVVNTASFCGYTYQYEGLVKLHRALEPKGLVVIGVPSQDFNQESANNQAIKTFCETNFNVDFPLAALTRVRGSAAHPFYQWVRTTRRWEPGWNFSKVLIGRDGQVIECYGSGDEPQGGRLSRAITNALQLPAA